MNSLIRFSEGVGSAPIVRFDPAVNRALTYATAYEFVIQQQTGNYKLTEQGKRLADQIKLVKDVMVTEISDLNDLSKKLTESKIKDIVEMRRDNHAED